MGTGLAHGGDCLWGRVSLLLLFLSLPPLLSLSPPYLLPPHLTAAHGTGFCGGWRGSGIKKWRWLHTVKSLKTIALCTLNACIGWHVKYISGNTLTNNHEV